MDVFWPEFRKIDLMRALYEHTNEESEDSVNDTVTGNYYNI